jgi:peptide/nickel transport system ATP-binding protein
MTTMQAPRDRSGVPATTTNPSAIALEDVRWHVRTPRGVVKAVDGVSFGANEGEIVCLVGESGCGKTTTGKIAAGLLDPTGGRVLFEGQDIKTLKGANFTRFRRGVQLVHQDPYASINPMHTVGATLTAPLERHKLASGAAARRRVAELLDLVDLTPSSDFVDKYPHQLSGGQRQRVAIARALTVEPRFIVADEPVSMVDVSIRISLLNTMLRLQRELNTGFLFITHDLALARYFAWGGRIGVMYVGRMVEMANAPDLVANPQHPYTRALLSAIPEADPELTRTKARVELRSLEVPSLYRLPLGCTFHPRCPQFEPGLCDVVVPALAQPHAGTGAGHNVACHVMTRATS